MKKFLVEFLISAMNLEVVNKIKIKDDKLFVRLKDKTVSCIEIIKVSDKIDYVYNHDYGHENQVNKIDLRNKIDLTKYLENLISVCIEADCKGLLMQFANNQKYEIAITTLKTN